MKKKPLIERINEYKKISGICPNKIPIIIDKNPKFPKLKNTTRNKLILDNAMTIDQFSNYFAKSCLQLEMTTLDTSLNIKLYTSSLELINECNLIDIYKKYKDEDGFLYLKYSYEYIKNSNIKSVEVSSKSVKEIEEKIALIIEKDPYYPYIKNLNKTKYLISKKITISQIGYLIFKKMLELPNKINETTLNFAFRTKNNYIELSNFEYINNIYDKYKDKDGYLQLYYSYEYTFKRFLHLSPLHSRKEEYQKLISSFPDKIPVYLEKNPNYLGLKEVTKKKFLLSNILTVRDFIDLVIKKYLEEAPIVGDKKLNLIVIETNNNLPLFKEEIFTDIQKKHKEEDGFVYLQYIYEYVQINNLEVIMPKYKLDNSFEKRKNIANFIISNHKIPVIIQKYPNSKLKDVFKKYETTYKYSIYQLKEMIEKELSKINNGEDAKICLMTDKNIDLRNQEHTLINDIYRKYLDQDGCLYLYYLETSLLPDLNNDNKNEIFNFKKLYDLEERRKEYQNLKNKYPKKIFIRIQKEFNIYDNDDQKDKVDDLFMYNPNIEIDSLKMKIWEQLGKPLLIVELMTLYQKIDHNYSKIIDLYNNFRDEEDGFVYLFYMCIKPNIEGKEKIVEKLSDNQKIFLLFKRIPFIIQPAPCFANSNTKTKVFLPYKSKTSTFSTIQTDKKYKYYIEYPNKVLNLNEVMYDFYLKNKNKEDDFLYLTIAKENNEKDSF